MVIMFLKPGQVYNEVESYRHIAQLLIMPKPFEQIFRKGLKEVIDQLHLVPTHQIGFSNKHSTID